MVGCSAGFVDVLKIKGTHNAIKTGVMAAESISKDFDKIGEGFQLIDYQKNVDASEVTQELKFSKDFKNGFKKGLFSGLINGALIGWTGKGFFNEKQIK